MAGEPQGGFDLSRFSLLPFIIPPYYKLQIQFAKANQKLEADKRTRADQISAALEQRTKEVEEHRKQLVQFQQAYETQNAEREEADKETILKSKKYQK